MSKRVKDLEYRVAVLEAQRDRVRNRLRRLSNACLVMSTYRYTKRFGINELMTAVAMDLRKVNGEFDRYYLEPEENKNVKIKTSK